MASSAKTISRAGIRSTRARAAASAPARKDTNASHANAAGSGCAVSGDETGGRRAIAVDPDIKDRNQKRLRRIEGQVRGLQKMVEEDRYCADILTQISSVHEALRSVGRELMRNHLKHCATAAIKAGPAEAESMYDELVDLVYT